MGSAGFVIAAIVLFASGAAAGAGLLLYWHKAQGEVPRFLVPRLFVPRSRRLAFVERTSLESGRKLMLVRRDDMEHLILVGGPIDLVVETGIRVESVATAPASEEDAASLGAPLLAVAPEPPLARPAPIHETAAHADPMLPPSAKAGEDEWLTEAAPVHDLKAAE